MEIARLIVEYLKALVWPVIVLVIAYSFRMDFVALSNRLTRAKLPGVDLSFTEEIDKAKKLSEEVAQAPRRLSGKGKPTIPLTEANKRMLSLGLRPSTSGLELDY